MKTLFFALLISLNVVSYGQESDKISTIDFVQILNDNKEETIYYYENNCKVLRKMALEKGYIHSYQLLEVPYSEDAPFQIMLMTTYLNEDQNEKSEDNFAELIKEKGPLKLMNDKEPGEFRLILFNKDKIRHWN